MRELARRLGDEQEEPEYSNDEEVRQDVLPSNLEESDFFGNAADIDVNFLQEDVTIFADLPFQGNVPSPKGKKSRPKKGAKF